MKHPNLFIVGAPKCGTTSMYAYLRAHPDVFMPVIKEPNFFADDLEILSYPEIDSVEAYLSLYEPSSGETILGDASQFHLYSKVAARRITTFAPDAKIIIMLREPVSMMRSLHRQYLSTFDEDVLSFSRVVALEDDRRRGENIPERTLFPRCMAYVDQARFSNQVERYLDVFPRHAVHVILLDDLRGDTEGVVQKTLEFLGVATSFVPDLTPHNVSQTVEDADSVVDARLRDLFVPEIDRLERLIGRDLSSWRVPR